MEFSQVLFASMAVVTALFKTFSTCGLTEGHRSVISIDAFLCIPGFSHSLSHFSVSEDPPIPPRVTLIYHWTPTNSIHIAHPVHFSLFWMRTNPLRANTVGFGVHLMPQNLRPRI